MEFEAVDLADWEVARTGAGAYLEPSTLPMDLDWVSAPMPGTAANAWRTAGRWQADAVFDFDADDWWFRCTFSASSGARRLRFGGIATIADVWLNDSHILHTDNMFHRHDLDVDVAAHNELVVVCRSVKDVLTKRRPRPQWRTKLVESQNLRWIRTSFLGRIPSTQPQCAAVGMWRPVTLGEPTAVVVESFSPRLIDGVATVNVRLLGRDADISDAWLHIDGQRHRLDLVEDGGGLTATVMVPNIEPWFPATHGDPRLYPTTLVADVNGNTRTVAAGSLGFRSVVADQTDDGFALVVNGVRVFSRGACWAPPDPVRLYTEHDALRGALEQVARSGANMLRVAGVGVYEQPEFFQLCDELGIMVWHDLMFANVDQPCDDDDFRASVTREIEQFLHGCQSHPCVVVVAGGSEVEQQGAMMGVEFGAAQNRVGRELLPALAEQVLPGIVHVPCSPSGGDFPFQVDRGVSHYFGVGAYRRPLDDARTCGAKFVSEGLAFATIPCRQTIDDWGVDPREANTSADWKRRVPRDRGIGWDFDDIRDHYVEEIFGVRPLDVRYSDAERYLDLGRAAVAEAVESTVREFRRPSSPNAGVLVISQRDALPGPGWGLVDAFGRPKSSYFAFRRASHPRAVSLHNDGLSGVRAVIFNDLDEPLQGELTVRLFAVNGVVVDQAKTPLKVHAAGVVEVSVDALLGHFLDLSYSYRFGPLQIDVIEATLETESAQRVDRTHLLPTGHRRDRRVDLGLRAWFEPAGDAVTVSVDQFAHFVSIDVSDTEMDDDWFHLSPGEERTVAVRSTTRPQGGSVRALNGYGIEPILANRGDR